MNRSDNPLHKCTDRARRVLQWAHALSLDRDNPDICPADLFDALTHGAGVSEAVLSDLGYPAAKFPESLPAGNDSLIGKSQTARRILSEAEVEADKLDHRYFGTEHLLLAMTALHPEVFTDADAVRHEVLALLGCGPDRA